MITDDQILSIVNDYLPGFVPQSSLNKLAGGNLNHLWRLEGKSHNLILKYAPPHIATSPEVPLDPDRMQFESHALQLFEEGRLLNTLVSDRIRPPKQYFYDEEHHLLAIGDIGENTELSQLYNSDLTASQSGKLLGSFIGYLHRLSLNHPTLKKQFVNTEIQQTRRKVQYEPAGDYAKKGGAGAAMVKTITSRTQELGNNLLSPGSCLTMGDLWPSSILMNKKRLRIIDWEFCHFGRPLQDVGHWGAHCWMLAHSSSKPEEVAVFKELWQHFWQAYQESAGDSFSQLYDRKEYQDTATHMGAEILIRATGAFKEGYVYEGISNSKRTIQEAVQKASELVKGDDFSGLWN